MMTFNDRDTEARDLAMHYASQLNNELAREVLSGKKNISNSEEAIAFTQFFWEMTDLAVQDYEDNIEINGILDFEHWMEKLMNIFIGYLKKSGFSQQWKEVSDRINSAD